MKWNRTRARLDHGRTIPPGWVLDGHPDYTIERRREEPYPDDFVLYERGVMVRAFLRIGEAKTWGRELVIVAEAEKRRRERVAS